LWRAGVEVQLLSGDIALDARILRVDAVALGHAGCGDFEGDGEEDREVPAGKQFVAVKEEAVGDEYGAGGRGLVGWVLELVGGEVVGGPAVLAGAGRAEGVEDVGSETVVVERVEPEAFGRQAAAVVSDRANVVEVVDRDTDDVPAARSQYVGQFVGERGLPGGVRTVDADAHAVVADRGRDEVGHPPEDLRTLHQVILTSRSGILTR
jgi:hypothetical protein